MKSRFLLTLPLAASVALSAAAQTAPANQSSSNPPEASEQSQPVGSSDQASKTHQPLTYEQHEGFWGKVNPFARKKYVQRQLTPVRDRMNELDELTAKNASAIKDVDKRAQEGIRMADARASQADQHAIDAGNRAQQAQQTAQQADSKLQSVQQVITNIDQYKPATQVEIVFRPGQVMLSQKAKSALDDMAKNLKDQRGYIIEVQGFAAGRGITAVQNSQKMADAAVRYLVLEHEVPVFRIYELGLGNVPAQPSAEGARPRRSTGGRVEVSLLKNEGLESLQQTATAAPGSIDTSNRPAEGTQPTAQPAPPQPVPPQQRPNAQPPLF